MEGPAVGKRKIINDGMEIMDQEEWGICLSLEATIGERKLGYRMGKTFK
jgi:hypothetical protein